MTAVDCEGLRIQQDAARQYVYQAVKNNELEKPTRCEWCGAELPLDGHHSDYKKPLKVIWLCRACHTSLHKGIRRALSTAKKNSRAGIVKPGKMAKLSKTGTGRA